MARLLAAEPDVPNPTGLFDAQAKPSSAKRTHTVPVYRCQLVAERQIEVAHRVMRGTDQCAALLHRYLDSPDREHLVVLLLERSGAVLGVSTVAIGGEGEVRTTVRSVMMAALLRCAERVVVAHNHLEDDPFPSRDDKRLTRALEKACELFAIRLADHIILGRASPKRYYSFLEHDQLKQVR